MAAVAEDLVVLPIRPQRKADPREVVAVVLADGSVRDLRGSGTRSSDARDWASGSVSGDDWTLWWERRRFSG